MGNVAHVFLVFEKVSTTSARVVCLVSSDGSPSMGSRTRSLRCTGWKRRLWLHSVDGDIGTFDEEAFVCSDGHEFECVTGEGRFMRQSASRGGGGQALYWASGRLVSPEVAILRS